MSATTTLVGNTTADVELRYTQNGKAVGSVTVAVADRKFDKQRNEYVDGNTWFARCTIWGEMAEHAAGTITKGTRVVALGRIEQREYDDRDGNKRTSIDVVLDEIGPSLKYATATVIRTQGGSTAPSSPLPPAVESWVTPTNDETPF
jgi:single-strand DNA-binding protein